jgi:hypothetical protein
MSDYAGLSTAELIDLLFKAEDRVTAAHIQELVRRADEVLPRLREILQDEITGTKARAAISGLSITPSPFSG